MERKKLSAVKVIIKKQKESGLTQTDFCKRSGIKPSTWAWWKKRVRCSKMPNSVKVEKLPVSMEPTQFEINLPSGACLKIHGATLDSVLHSLKGNGLC